MTEWPLYPLVTCIRFQSRYAAWSNWTTCSGLKKAQMDSRPCILARYTKNIDTQPGTFGLIVTDSPASCQKFFFFFGLPLEPEQALPESAVSSEWFHPPSIHLVYKGVMELLQTMEKSVVYLRACGVIRHPCKLCNQPWFYVWKHILRMQRLLKTRVSGTWGRDCGFILSIHDNASLNHWKQCHETKGWTDESPDGDDSILVQLFCVAMCAPRIWDAWHGLHILHYVKKCFGRSVSSVPFSPFTSAGHIYFFG